MNPLSALTVIYGTGYDRQKITALKAVVVPRVGLEPTHLAAGDFESPASTNFATWAGEEAAIIMAFKTL